MSEQKHIPSLTQDTNLTAFLTSLQRIEDRLILVSLPVIIFTLILWAVASAFPVTGIVTGLVVSILLLLVTCVMLLRLVEVAWQWWDIEMKSNSDNPFYIWGIISIGVLVIIGVVCLVDMVIHAGKIGPSHVALMIGLLLLLALQYRSIIYRHLASKEPAK